MCLNVAPSRICSMLFSGTDRPVVPRVLIFSLFKYRCNVALFPVIAQFTWMPWLLKYHGEWVGNYISQFPQDSGMPLIGSHRVMYIRIPHVVMNLILQWKGLCSSSPQFVTHTLERCEKRGWQWRLRENVAKCCHDLQPSPPLLLPVCQFCSSSSSLNFSGWHACRPPAYCWCPLPNLASATLWPSWPHPYTAWKFSLYSSQDICKPVLPVWNACAFPFCLLVWPEGLSSNCQTLLSSYTWQLRTPVCCVIAQFCSLVAEGSFPGVLLDNSWSSWNDIILILLAAVI